MIHVAGTNGKGSTIAFMRSILEAGRPGRPRLHVAAPRALPRADPHRRDRRRPFRGRGPAGRRLRALRVRERRRADHDVRDHHGGAAFLLFSESPADVLLLEVGLGGRLDATNVIDRPACAVVTPIGRDHAEYLGDTVESVATEKAGIFKRGCPAVIAAQDYAEADAVLCRRAEAVGAGSDPGRQPGFLRARGARPPRLSGRDRPVRPAAAPARRPPPAGQCRNGDHRAPRRRVRRHRNRGPGDGD
ncbi:Mur ligase family protein [Methylobacterium oryzae CBMB20]